MDTQSMCILRAARRSAGVIGVVVALAAPPGWTQSTGELGALRAEVSELARGLAALQSVEAELAELRAREEIRTLFVDYGRTLDDRDFTAFGALFAPDAEFVGGGNTGPAQGPEAIAAMLEGAISQNASGANLHVFMNEKIAVSGDQATATSRGAFVGQDEEGAPTFLIYATYEDELVKHDGRWKFKRRRIVGDIPGPPNESR